MSFLSILNRFFANKLESNAVELAKEIAELTEGTIDKKGKLKIIMERNSAFLSLLRSMSAVAAKSVTEGSTNDEEKAIEHFRRKMEQQFEKRRSDIGNILMKLNGRVDLDIYNENVCRYVDTLFRSFNFAMKSKIPIEDRKKELDKVCSNINPNGVISYLEFALINNCPFPKYEDAQKYSKLYEFFIGTEAHPNFGIQSEEYAELKWSEFFIIAEGISEILSSPSSIYMPNNEFLEKNQSAIIYQLRLLLDDVFPNSCLFKRIHPKYEFESALLYSLIDYVRFDLEFFAGICIDYEYSGRPESIEEKYSDLNNVVLRISEHIDKWVALKLETSWPNVLEVRAKKAILEKKTENLNVTADWVLLEIDKMAPIGLQHYVILRNEAEYNREWKVDAVGRWAAVVTGFHGYDVFIFRHSVADSQRAVMAEKWFGDNETAMRKVLDDIYDKHDNSLENLIADLDQRMGGIKNENRYRTVLGMRVTAFLEMLCSQSYGFTDNVRLNGTKPYSVLYYHKNPIMSKCADIYLIFFL